MGRGILQLGWKKSALLTLRLIGCYYQPPLGTKEALNYFTSSLYETIAKINLDSIDVVIVEDFNANHSSWWTLDSTSSVERLLQQYFQSLGRDNWIVGEHTWTPTEVWHPFWIVRSFCRRIRCASCALPVKFGPSCLQAPVQFFELAFERPLNNQHHST